MIKGYDISNTNGRLLLSDYPDAEFFIAKVCQDGTFVDKVFPSYRQQARALGKAFAGYLYADNNAEPDPIRSCDRFIYLLGDQEEGEFAAIDIEANSGLGGFQPGDHSAWVTLWGKRFRQRKGYKCKLYTSEAGLDDYGLRKQEVANEFDLWLAWWPYDPTNLTPPPPPSPWTSENFKLWQQNADGIDKDYWLGTIEELKATGYKKEPSTNPYEERYWTPIQKLLDDMIANSKYPHADAAFHASVSNAITLHKIALGVEPSS